MSDVPVTVSPLYGDTFTTMQCVVEDGNTGECASPALSSSSSSVTPTSRPKRFCANQTCRRIIGSASNDPHTVCIVCRPGICTVNTRCSECDLWTSEIVLHAFKYQSALQKKRESRARRKAKQSSIQGVKVRTFPTSATDKLVPSQAKENVGQAMEGMDNPMPYSHPPCNPPLPSPSPHTFPI